MSNSGDWTNLIFARDLTALGAAIDAGASADHFREGGQSALALAAGSGYHDVVTLLLARGAGLELPNRNGLAYTPLIEAARKNRTAMVTQLLDAGAQLEGGDSRKGTALLHACINADLATAQLLLERGANVDSLDNQEQTPLHYLARNAASWGSGVITETVNGVTRQVDNPRLKQHLAVIELLLERGAAVNKLTGYGLGPLHLAGESGSPELVELLVKHKGDVNLCNSKQYSPLHTAADNGHAKAAAAMLAHGARVDAVDSSGFTALLSAVLAGSVDTVSVLLAHGADRSLRATEGYKSVAAGDTALDVARKLGRADLVAPLEAPAEKK